MNFKSLYIQRSKQISVWFCVLLSILFSIDEARATHALPIVNLQSNNTGTEIIISGSSDAGTCNSTDAYYLQVEIICTMANFTGVANYLSDPFMKPNCVEAAYN